VKESRAFASDTYSQLSSAMSSSSSLFDSCPDFKPRSRMIIQGHRGGFKPDNVMSTFRRSVDEGLDAIEIDVWVSKDGVPMVMHGGDDGQLKDYGHPSELVFEWTKEKLRTLDAGNGEQIPTLCEVLELIKKSSVFVNIELKGPQVPKLAERYDPHVAINAVLDTINKHQMQKRFLISSFNHKDLLKAAHIARSKIGTPYFDIIYLRNYHNEPFESMEHAVPKDFAGDGINVSASYIS